MNFLFACGGTAGHINPALAIAAELCRRDTRNRALFVGAGKELEKRLIPQAGYHLVNITMSGLKRGVSPGELLYNMKTVRNLVTAGVKAEKLLRRFAPDAVIGTGGYICYPILKKAAQMGIPTVVHESNAVPGLTTKLLSARVDRVLTSFPGLESEYRRPKRVIFTGTPVRGGFAAAGDAGVAENTGETVGTPENTGKPLVVSFWGSLGAERMNESMAEFIKLNADTGAFAHIHAAGKNGGAELIRSRIRQLGFAGELPGDIEIRDYIDDMPNVMAAAALALCRAGGSTIAELTVSGKPAVLIPSPYVTNDQQTKNAIHAEKAGGALLLREKDCTGKVLYDIVAALLSDAERLNAMAAAQRELGSPDAAQRIADIVLELC